MPRETYTMQVASRAQNASERTSAQSLRKQGLLPLVVYGHGIETIPLKADRIAFERLMRTAGQSSIVMLTIEGEQESRPVIVQDIQYDVLSRQPIHADLYQVRMDETIEAEVPFVFTGEAPAVKEEEGVVVKNMQSVTVRALPLDLPSEIEVSLEPLEHIDDALHVSNLHLPDGVEVLADPDAPVVLVEAPLSEEELEEALAESEEADLEAIEVEGEEEEEGEELEEEGEESERKETENEETQE